MEARRDCDPGYVVGSISECSFHHCATIILCTPSSSVGAPPFWQDRHEMVGPPRRRVAPEDGLRGTSAGGVFVLISLSILLSDVFTHYIDGTYAQPDMPVHELRRRSLYVDS